MGSNNIPLTTRIKCNIFASGRLEFMDWPTPFNEIEDVFLRVKVKIRFIHMLAAFGAVFLLVAGNANAEKKLHVFVSLPPQKYFVQQIGRALVDVEVMIPAGADPHIYEPKPRQMVALSKARLLLRHRDTAFRKHMAEKDRFIQPGYVGGPYGPWHSKNTHGHPPSRRRPTRRRA